MSTATTPPVVPATTTIYHSASILAGKCNDPSACGGAITQSVQHCGSVDVKISIPAKSTVQQPLNQIVSHGCLSRFTRLSDVLIVNQCCPVVVSGNWEQSPFKLPQTLPKNAWLDAHNATGWDVANSSLSFRNESTEVCEVKLCVIGTVDPAVGRLTAPNAPVTLPQAVNNTINRQRNVTGAGPDLLANDIAGTNPLDPASVQIVSGTSLPAGVVISATGVIGFDGSTPAGIYQFQYTVADTLGNRSNPATVTLNLTNPTLVMLAVPPQTGTVGVVMSFTPTVTGGQMPYVFSVVGQPQGINLVDVNTGELRGPPTVPTVGTPTLTVTDATGATASQPVPYLIT